MVIGVKENAEKAAPRNATRLSRKPIGFVDISPLSPARQLLLIVLILVKPRWNVVTRALVLVASVAWVVFTNDASCIVVVF